MLDPSGVVMAAIRRSHRIRVSSSSSASGTAWTVFVAGMRDAIFTGDAARGRAIECALRRAEDLRASGPALVVVEPVVGGAHETREARVLESRLAS